MKTKRITGCLLVVAGSMFLVMGSCASDPAKVSKSDLTHVRRAADKLTIGMSKDDVLQSIGDASTKRLTTSRVGGISIEEYTVEAYYDDDWNKSRDLYKSFLYFADGTLVEIADRRIDYGGNPEIVKQWTGK